MKTVFIKGSKDNLETYLTTDLDGHYFIGSVSDLSKGDLILGKEYDENYFYQVRNVGKDLHKTMMEYYFNSKEDMKENVVDLRRQRFSTLSTKGTFEVTFKDSEGNILGQGLSEKRPSNNQTFIVGDNVIKVKSNLEKNKRNLVFLVDKVEVKPFKMYYSIEKENNQIELYETYSQFLTAKSEQRK